MQSSIGKVRRRLPGLLFLKRSVLAAIFCLSGGALILSTPLGAGIFFNWLQAYPPLTQAELTEASSGPPAAIVILSAGRRKYAPEFQGDTGIESLDALSLERVRYGAYLGRKTGLPILVSGGSVPIDEHSLAAIMADTLWTDYGIRVKWLENRSTTTAENAIFSAEILKQEGVNRVILVTHAWHMKRAMAAFVANGMSVQPAPTAFYRPNPGALVPSLNPSMTAFRMSGYAIHETVGGLWYRLRYGY